MKQRIKKLLKEQRYNFGHLAKEMKYTQAHISRVMGGHIEPSEKFIICLCFSLSKMLNRNITKKDLGIKS
jgi:hypothetical protein